MAKNNSNVEPKINSIYDCDKHNGESVCHNLVYVCTNEKQLMDYFIDPVDMVIYRRPLEGKGLMTPYGIINKFNFWKPQSMED